MSRYDPYNPMEIAGKLQLDEYLKVESDFTPLDFFYKDPKNVEIRKAAIHAMLGYDEITDPYIAMNLFDRFFSRNGILVMEETMSQEIELIALSCLSLASKMRTKQHDPAPNGILYSQKKKKIEEAELLIRSALGNKLNSITALSFAPHQYNICVGEELPVTVSTIIVETQDDARFTGFKPSIVSAAAVLTAIADLHPKLIPLFPIFVKALKGMDKELLRPCFVMVVEMCKKQKLLPRYSIRHKRWFIEPTKGPMIKIALKWSVGLDIHELFRAINSVARFSCRLALVIKRIDFLVQRMEQEEDDNLRNVLSSLEKKRTYLVLQLILLG